MGLLDPRFRLPRLPRRLRKKAMEKVGAGCLSRKTSLLGVPTSLLGVREAPTSLLRKLKKHWPRVAMAQSGLTTSNSGMGLWLLRRGNLWKAAQISSLLRL